LTPPVLALCITLALAACASQSARTSGTFASGGKPAEPFHKILVVGVSPDRNGRCPFERFLLSRLEGEVTEAVASCDVMSKEAPLTKELVEQAVAEQHADAVLATLLVSQDWNAQHGGSRDTRGSAGYKATDSGWSSGYYGMYGVPVIYGEFQSNAASLVITGNVKLTSRLYETRGKTVVYTLETTGKGIEQRDAGLSMVTDAIGEQLTKDGLIK
jgi:hypothetical protein